MTNSTQQKLDELEILQSIYPDLIVIDDQDRLDCQELSKDTSEKPILRFAIKFSQIELSICLPGNYPDTEVAEIRIVWSSLSSQMLSKIIEIMKTTVTAGKGQPVMLDVISSVIDVIDDLSAKQLAESSGTGKNDTLVVKVVYNRLWYYAHHIYSKGKRSNMLQWSKDLSLNGFILPGKPGIICVEGPQKSCKDFNSLVRAMNWQLLKLQHDEMDLTLEQLKFQSFKELILTVHGRAHNHHTVGREGGS